MHRNRSMPPAVHHACERLFYGRVYGLKKYLSGSGIKRAGKRLRVGKRNKTNLPIDILMEPYMKMILTALTLSLITMGSALASPATDAAQMHFAAVGANDVALLMRGYSDNAQLTWVGGPLDGTYTGADAIQGTWVKFGKAVGPLKVTVSNLEESANPKGSTVSANVQFESKMPIKVRYLLTYRDGKLVNETWQIDPKLTVASY